MSSSGATMVKVKIETDIEVRADELVKVLIIDDEQSVRDSWARLFQSKGYAVSVAASPDEAIALLKTNSYEMIVADILFENSEVTGDQLITENIDLMRQATVVAITGFGKDRIERLKELESMKVKVLEKGESKDELIQIVTQKLEQRKQQVAETAKQSLLAAVYETVIEPSVTSTGGEDAMSHRKPRVGKVTAEYLVQEVQRMLVDWFKSRQEPDKKSIVYGGRTFSANELALEVEQGTEIGREHVAGMIDLFKMCLNIK